MKRAETFKPYAIQNFNNKNFYWNNKYGWVNDSEFAIADTYTEKELGLYNLPLEGRWVLYEIHKQV